MHSHHLETHLDPPGNFYSQYLKGALFDRLQQPSVIVPLLLLLFSIIYQSLHSSPFSRPRHPGELLRHFFIVIIPSNILYALDNWLHPPSFPIPESLRPARSRSYTAKSELLRRILGMDGTGGIITSVADAGRRSLSSLSNSTLIKHKTDQPPGLGNYDNSCFQNSILQGLSSLKPFPSYLARGLEQDNSESGEESGSATSLRDLISKLTDASYNGKTLWTPKKLKSLDTWQQQDAQEYFSKILDEVEKEMSKATKPKRRSSGFELVSIRDDTEDSQHSDDSGYQSLPVLSKAVSDARILRNPLEGLVAQRVACVLCGHSDGLSMIPFNCLTLSLGREQTEHDLFERLDSYTDLETIEGVECAKCTLLKLQRLLKLLISRGKENNKAEDELRGPISRLEAVELALEEDDFGETAVRDKCQVQKRVSSAKTKQVAIARPPQSLAIHMNRSVFDESTGRMFKNLAAVRFPKTLDLGPWCIGSADDVVSSVDSDKAASINTLGDEEHWVTDPMSSMVSGDLKPSKISGPIYELRAVITHQGRHENGHYICYRKHPCEPSKFNDNVNQETESLNDADDIDGNDSNDDQDPDAKWWRLSDESVWEVAEETVLAQGGVFMLFYDCVDPHPVLVPTIRHETKLNNDTTSFLNEGNKVDNLKTTSTEGGLINISSENNEQFGNTTTLEQLQRQVQAAAVPDDNASQMSDVAGEIEAANTQLQKREIIWSSLTPPLADGEMVDSIIPLHRPNR
ncbi:cysteine proteinase [Annulohypoxylon maeteangense]|uniref:cysteine proteinase n=1 Tax=Annulohypoxylon maeteangense TaxID=1927788 RepID=UPI002007E058|nr:cysteine proteinase [Annulohypoxylon maeteangense]KAI0883311.1 cysteine proteinase [Annulohypoxylon maeteangense]